MHLITVSKNYFDDNDDDARGSFDEHHSRLFVPSQVFFENNDENEWKIHIAPKRED